MDLKNFMQVVGTTDQSDNILNAGQTKLFDTHSHIDGPFPYLPEVFHNNQTVYHHHTYG
jgi:hypothetical protein